MRHVLRLFLSFLIGPAALLSLSYVRGPERPVLTPATLSCPEPYELTWYADLEVARCE